MTKCDQFSLNMPDWTMSREEEDVLSSEEEDVLSSEEESDALEGYENYQGAVSTSVPFAVPAGETIKVITKASLLSTQREYLHEVMEILHVKEKHARTLLIHYRWDVERLLEAFVDRGTDWLFSQAGVAIRLELTNSPVTICNICAVENLKEKNTTTMDCGHTFCNVCWRKHFLTKIKEGHSKRMKCMSFGCNVICDEDIVRKLVSAKDPRAAQRFDRFLLESYIDDNNKVKWCPSVPHCGNAIRVEGDVYCEIECTCGKQFCFNCLAQPHSPCSCLIWELWDRKCQDESETFNWIAANTKSCPKCGKNVEKNGGCNLMTCVCGQLFCWLCGGATGQSYHAYKCSCSRYEEVEEEETEKARRDLKRYTHYYSRWKAHEDSLKLETKQTESLDKRISDFERKESGVREYSWLTKALQTLFSVRRALCCTYPFAFHMFGDDILEDKMTASQKELKHILFEDHQQQLEETVERLSKIIEGAFERLPKIIEGAFEEESVMDIRKQVMDLSHLADSRCRKMYECIQNDLLTTHRIAPYNSNGVQRALE